MSHPSKAFDAWFQECLGYAKAVQVPDFAQPNRSSAGHVVSFAPESTQDTTALRTNREALAKYTVDTLAKLLGVEPAAPAAAATASTASQQPALGADGQVSLDYNSLFGAQATSVFTSFQDTAMGLDAALVQEEAHTSARKMFQILATKPKFTALLLPGWEGIAGAGGSGAAGGAAAAAGEDAVWAAPLVDYVLRQLSAQLASRGGDLRRSEEACVRDLQTLRALLALAAELHALAVRVVYRAPASASSSLSLASPLADLPARLVAGTASRLARAFAESSASASAASGMAQGLSSDSYRVEVVGCLRAVARVAPAAVRAALAEHAADKWGMDVLVQMGGLASPPAVAAIVRRVSVRDAQRGRTAAAKPGAGAGAGAGARSQSVLSSVGAGAGSGAAGHFGLGDEDDLVLLLMDAAADAYKTGAVPLEAAVEAAGGADSGSSAPSSQSSPSSDAKSAPPAAAGGAGAAHLHAVRVLTAAESEGLLRVACAGVGEQPAQYPLVSVADHVPDEDTRHTWWRDRWVAWVPWRHALPICILLEISLFACPLSALPLSPSLSLSLSLSLSRSLSLFVF